LHKNKLTGKWMRCVSSGECPACGDKPGRLRYEVKWKGYDKGHNTWEPRSHLMEEATGSRKRVPMRPLLDWDRAQRKRAKQNHKHYVN
jgi:hypothetical protein